MGKIFVVTGQTASGKTEYAIKLASQYNGELVNCDSRQIYKYLDIISGKDLTDRNFHSVEKKGSFDIGFYAISSKENKIKGAFPIWLYDIIKPDQAFSSFEYVGLALMKIGDILKRKKTPVIVGGTYFYLYHLLYEVPTAAIEPDWNLRKELEKKTLGQLQKIYESLDQVSFQKLNDSDRCNPHRLMRKIEIIKSGRSATVDEFSTDKPISLPEKLGDPNLEVDYIGLHFATRINEMAAITQRVEKRYEEGAIDEMKQIIALGYDEETPGMKTIGYQQLFKHLRGSSTLQQATEEWINREMQYAKRQFTFMKRDRNIRWIGV